MKDAERKAAEQEVRMRHVEGLRQQMKKKGIDVDNMKDPGFTRLNPEVFATPAAFAKGVAKTSGFNRVNPEVFATPLAKAAGVKVGREFKAPVSARLGLTSPYMKTTVTGRKTGGFRRVVGKVLSAAKKIIGIGDDTMGQVAKFERKKKVKKPSSSQMSSGWMSGLASMRKTKSPPARRRSY